MIENLVIRNKETDSKIDLSMSNDDFVLEEVNFGTIGGSHQTYHYPTQKGQTKYASTLGIREAKIIGWIIGESKDIIADRKKKLNSLVNPLEDLEIEVEKEYFITLSPDSTVKYESNFQQNNDVMCRFEINGKCFNPVFESGEKKVFAAGTEESFMFPLIIPEEGYVFSKKVASLTCRVENEGSLATGIKIIFRANGTVKNPSLVDINTQECFKINKTLVADEIVEIDTSIGKRTVVGKLNGEEFNYFKYRDLDDGDWIALNKGVNNYRYDAEEGLDNLDVVIKYNEEWLEVDA